MASYFIRNLLHFIYRNQLILKMLSFFFSYGNEEDMTTLTGVLQALVSCVQNDNNDQLRSICAGNYKFVFLYESPIILVMVSRQCESVRQLHHQLVTVYNQVLSILTASQLTRIFDQRKNFDLRRLLTGTQKTFENLLLMMDSNTCFLLNAVKVPYDVLIITTVV